MFTEKREWERNPKQTNLIRTITDQFHGDQIRGQQTNQIRTITDQFHGDQIRECVRKKFVNLRCQNDTPSTSTVCERSSRLIG